MEFDTSHTNDNDAFYTNVTDSSNLQDDTTLFHLLVGVPIACIICIKYILKRTCRSTENRHTNLLENINVINNQLWSSTADLQKNIQRKEYEYNESNIHCSICLETFIEQEEILQLRCSHMFHENCLLPWFNKDNSCPLCRAPVIH